MFLEEPFREGNKQEAAAAFPPHDNDLHVHESRMLFIYFTKGLFEKK